MSRYKKNIIHNRMYDYLLICIFAFILLISRLFWIQIKNHHNLNIQVLRQRGKEFDLYPKRGIIYDRNLIPLTNRQRVNVLFALKNNIIEDQSLKHTLLNNTSLDYEEFEKRLKDDEKIVEIPLHTIKPIISNWSNILIHQKVIRYDENSILSHVIGYINKSENKGEFGIEKVYDDILKNIEREDILFIELDEREEVVLGSSINVDSKGLTMEPSGVKLTIDYHIQKIVENILDKNEVNGAVIVAEVKSGEIRALASRPNFNQDDVDKYLNRDDMALYNKGIQVAYPPGSLFKLVVLAAALEHNLEIQDKEFYCNGYERVGNVIINCNDREGHGSIDIKEAFSKSCNSVFIQLGKMLGGERIIQMAKKMGFGEKVHIGLLEEVKGNLPEGDELHGAAIGNISIGQGSIETTPLQITNMMAIVANGGIKTGLTIVDGITNYDGHMIKKNKRIIPQKVLSEANSLILKECLIDVVDNGTAKNMSLKDLGGAGGKTGSAQAVLNRKETIHAWFSGFYPKEEPKYVITVIIEEGYSGSKTAAPIFENIVKEIEKINR
ncbi:peptidoglycan D,D-transpeptidase FtsI family protein [Tepidimicrobium xylanilyticum]|uniref:peptidoglycan D,D-transpeptidase FtsI family protein n=1 Tax=Tepidimicrobium xylanilyticum TaxID=1123352 RepID=UPI0026541D95|nr:penicillin-binding protein 2 [Tepidimicrobium xylanilyticum]GMG96214.1 peptidoglycan glycosyltransferase [Tepidimicrobium xylanilyticum]